MFKMYVRKSDRRPTLFVPVLNVRTTRDKHRHKLFMAARTGQSQSRVMIALRLKKQRRNHQTFVMSTVQFVIILTV